MMTFSVSLSFIFVLVWCIFMAWTLAILPRKLLLKGEIFFLYWLFEVCVLLFMNVNFPSPLQWFDLILIFHLDSCSNSSVMVSDSVVVRTIIESFLFLWKYCLCFLFATVALFSVSFDLYWRLVEFYGLPFTTWRCFLYVFFHDSLWYSL